MSKLVTGIFHSRSRAEQASDELVRAGFAPEDVSLLMSGSTRGREFVVKGSTKAPEGAMTGAAIGGALGAVAAGLIGLGMPEHEAEFYHKEIENGGILRAAVLRRPWNQRFPPDRNRPAVDDRSEQMLGVRTSKIWPHTRRQSLRSDPLALLAMDGTPGARARMETKGELEPRNLNSTGGPSDGLPTGIGRFPTQPIPL